MRALVVAEQLRRPVEGGIGTYVRGLLGGLRIAGVDVTLFASRPCGGGPDPLLRLGPAVTSPLPAPVLVRAWDRGLSRLPPPVVSQSDVVHATSFALPPSPGPPMSVMVHDLAWRDFPEAYPPRGLRWHEAALGRALRRAARYVVPSTPVADGLLAAGAPAGRVEVVEEGCDHLAPPDDDAAAALLARVGVTGDFLLSVSTLEPRKNLSRLVAAYQRARPRLPEPWPLVVVGPSGWGEALKPGPGVVPVGRADGGVLSALYGRARLLAYVPLREGFGLPVAEAMSCGTPVVASPVPSAGGAALEVDPFDVDGIAAGLVSAACDQPRRAELAAAGRARAGGLTWERAARAHASLWEEMCR